MKRWRGICVLFVFCVWALWGGPSGCACDGSITNNNGRDAGEKISVVGQDAAELEPAMEAPTPEEASAVEPPGADVMPEPTVAEEPMMPEPTVAEEPAGADAPDVVQEAPPEAQGTQPCNTQLTGVDRERYVVVSHPYDAKRNKVGAYEVLCLSKTGQLRKTNQRFTMEPAIFGAIHFTPDGSIGLVRQERGTIGVFRFDEQGLVQVVHKGFKGNFYASSLVIEPGGKRAYVLDGNWRNNGGGIYIVDIAADGKLTDGGIIAAAKLPLGMVLLPGNPGRAVVAAKDFLTSIANMNIHLVGLTPPSVVHSVDGFGDDKAIISAAGITSDGRFALFGDNSAFSGLPNRVSIVEIDKDKLKASKVITPFKDPVDIVASPYNNALLLVSGIGDALYRLPYTPTATPAFGTPTPLTYKGKKPQLPNNARLLAKEPLKGRVLISENVAVRQVHFEASGQITDHGTFNFGSGYPAIVGVVGVQP